MSDLVLPPRIFIPDKSPVATALKRTTHLGIGAHPDDLEFMAFHGIWQCYQKSDQWFTGITVTNGRGSSRGNNYTHLSDEEFIQLRAEEQETAATLGQFSAMIQLEHESSLVKKNISPMLVNQLVDLITKTQPQIIYTHNLADKHLTHIGVAIATIKAIRLLPKNLQPQKLYGCEVWRSLDWLPDSEKIAHDISPAQNLMMKILATYQSQISGSKNYHEATLGRKIANAVYFEAHDIDTSSLQEFAMDLTPLIQNNISITEFVLEKVEKFKNEIHEGLKSFQL